MRPPKRIVVLSSAEYQLAFVGLLQFRNKPIRQGRYTDAVDELLCALPLNDNNAVFNLCCSLCTAYERKAFIDGLQYGAQLMTELK